MNKFEDLLALIDLPDGWNLSTSKIGNGERCVYVYSIKENKALVVYKNSLYQLNDFSEQELVKVAKQLSLKVLKTRQKLTNPETLKVEYITNKKINSINNDDFQLLISSLNKIFTVLDLF